MKSESLLKKNRRVCLPPTAASHINNLGWCVRLRRYAAKVDLALCVTLCGSPVAALTCHPSMDLWYLYGCLIATNMVKVQLVPVHCYEVVLGGLSDKKVPQNTIVLVPGTSGHANMHLYY